MVKPSLDSAREKALKDLSNADAFALIVVENGKIHRHLIINGPETALAFLRCFKEAEMSILMPPPSQPSRIIKP